MNNLGAIKEEIEEIMRKDNRFPIDFEAGGPFGIAARTSISETKKNIEGITIPESLIASGTSSQLIGGICDIVDEQLERWLSKLGNTPPNVFLLNNIGKTYLSKGKPEIALKYFNEALALKKNLPQVKANIIKAYILQGKLEEALAICLEDEKTHANDINLLMTLAYLYLRRGEIEKVKEKLDTILVLDPKKIAAYHNRGVVRLLSNQINEAINDFRKAINLDERSAQTYNALAACYMLTKAYKKSIKYFLISLNIEKTNIHVLKNLAKTYILDKQFKEAADLMEKHLLNYPMDNEARDITALSYLNLKEYERCMVHLNYQMQKRDELNLNDFDIARISNNMGVIEGYSNKFDQAIQMYKAAIQKCDESHAYITYSNLLKTYLASDRLDAANLLLDEYIRKGLKNNSPFIILASYYYDHDEYMKSHDLLIRILEKESDNVPAMQLLSSIYSEALDDLDKSLELAKRAFNLRPSDQNLANNLAYIYIRKGLVSEARNVFEKQRWDKNNFFALATKGLLRLTEGYVTEGTNLYNEAEKQAWNTEWKRLVRQKKYVELARYYLNRSKLQEAQHELNRALSTKPKANIYKYQADKLLASLQRQQLI